MSRALSQSPSSVRWHLEDYYQYKRRKQQPKTNTERLGGAWKVPSASEMQRRQAKRQAIREETLQHRRIHNYSRVAGTRNICHVLENRNRLGARNDSSPSLHRSTPFSTATTSEEIRYFAETASVRKYHSAFLGHLGGDEAVEGQQQQQQQRSASSPAVSTISVAFSPDSQTMASTHGDHSVKISSCGSGHLLESLEGHPRTPWTVKYHPTNADIVASGCLGHQVRVWNWKTATCLNMVRLDFAIISLSFHPSGEVLAIANGTRLHFWGWDSPQAVPANNDVAAEGETSINIAADGQQQQQQQAPPPPPGHRLLVEVEQRHMLRCVHFPPNGSTLIVGGVNPTTAAHRPRRGGISGGGMSFYLRLWDFDLNTALQRQEPASPSAGLRRRLLSNPRTFVPRALLYNDGGFDVSPDGKTLCCCAEYWLPDGVNTAMDIFRENGDDGDESDEDDNDDDMEDSDLGADGVGDEEAATTGEGAIGSDAAQDPSPRTASSGTQTPVRRPSDDAMDVTPSANTEAPGSSPPRLTQITPRGMQTPSLRASFTTPQTPPPNQVRSNCMLSPPSPPGRRFAGGLGQRRTTSGSTSSTAGGGIGRSSSNVSNVSTGSNVVGSGQTTRGIPPPPPPPPGIQGTGNSISSGGNSVRSQRPPNPYTGILQGPNTDHQNGRYVPHVVTISLDTAPVANDLVPGRANHNHPSQGQPNSLRPASLKVRPRLGQLLEACPLDGAKASAVTCVKFSPSTDFCLIGYGVREPMVEHNGNHYHPVTALYRVKGGMTHISTMLSGDDDVNIARFHPDPGYGFVYGTKQGRVRVLSPRPWNYYNC